MTVDNVRDPFVVTTCQGYFQLVLTGPDLPLVDGRPLCSDSLTIPSGRSNYVLRVRVQRLICGAQPEADTPCTDEAMRRIRPGNYKTVLTHAEPALPMPAPIPVRITNS